MTPQTPSLHDDYWWNFTIFPTITIDAEALATKAVAMFTTEFLFCGAGALAGGRLGCRIAE